MNEARILANMDITVLVHMTVFVKSLTHLILNLSSKKKGKRLTFKESN